jgi:hypothetical protein
MHQRAFSFFSTEDAAEVQLGGYDPARCIPQTQIQQYDSCRAISRRLLLLKKLFVLAY